MEILSICPNCKKTISQNCECGAPRFPFATDQFLKDGTLNQCPLCGCAHVYRQKDFNRRLGLGLVVVGVLLAYWTYGISLVVVTLIDWLLIRRVKEVGLCYQCFGQFRNSPKLSELEPFNLSLHDYYNNLRNAKRVD